MRELISSSKTKQNTTQNKKAQAGNEWSNIFPQSPQARKKPPSYLQLPPWVQQTEQTNMATKMRLVSSPLCPSVLENKDSGAHPAEMPQLRHAEEDPLASGDPPPLQTRQALRLSAETGEDSSNRCARWSVLLSSDRQEDKKKKKTGG